MATGVIYLMSEINHVFLKDSVPGTVKTTHGKWQATKEDVKQSVLG